MPADWIKYTLTESERWRGGKVSKHTVTVKLERDACSHGPRTHWIMMTRMKSGVRNWTEYYIGMFSCHEGVWIWGTHEDDRLTSLRLVYSSSGKMISCCKKWMVHEAKTVVYTCMYILYMGASKAPPVTEECCILNHPEHISKVPPVLYDKARKHYTTCCHNCSC